MTIPYYDSEQTLKDCMAAVAAGVMPQPIAERVYEMALANEGRSMPNPPCPKCGAIMREDPKTRRLEMVHDYARHFPSEFTPPEQQGAAGTKIASQALTHRQVYSRDDE